MSVTKHHVGRCIVCRDYAQHEKAKRGPGNWVAKLGPIHLVTLRARQRTRCGRRRRQGMIWTLERKLATCRSCKRAR